MRTPTIFALIVAAALLSAAAPAEAIYIVTPLSLHLDTDRADVGDDVDLDITPNQDNATARDDWAGKKVKVGYSYDKNEPGPNDDPDTPRDDSGHTEREIGEVTLDDQARGHLVFTVPAEVQDRNVHLFIEDASGERLAFANMAVGNATPMMYAMSGPGNAEDLEQGSTEEDDDAPAAQNDAPGVGLLAILGALGAVLVALRRRA